MKSSFTESINRADQVDQLWTDSRMKFKPENERLKKRKGLNRMMTSKGIIMNMVKNKK